MSETDSDALQKHSRWLLWITTAVFAAIAAVMALTVIVVAIKFPVMSAGFLQRLAASWAPALFYLWGLWGLRGMFKALTTGGPTFDAVAKALTRVGWALLLGAAAGFALTPFATAGGVRHMGSFAILSVPSLTLGLVGLALIAVSGLLSRAAAIEAQNRRLKATLEDFI